MYNFKPDTDTSYLSSKSKLLQNPLEKCPHLKQISSKTRNNCFFCGIHLSKNHDIASYKTTNFSFKALMDIENFSIFLFKKKLLKETTLKSSHPYNKNRVNLIEMMYKVGERLHLSQNTCQMAVTYLDFVVIKGYIPSGQYQIYALTAIMLAAKAIELDRRIPYISSLRKAAIEDYKPEEIKKTEEIMLEILDWNTQFATLIDIIEYFLSQGVVFSNDFIAFSNKSADLNEFKPIRAYKQEIIDKTEKFVKRIEKSKSVFERTTAFSKKNKENEEKAEENAKIVKDLSLTDLGDLVSKIEKESRNLTNLLIKDASFLESNTKMLAGAIIAFIRRKNGLKKQWNDELSYISNGIKESEICNDFNKIVSKFEENPVVSIENEMKSARKHRNTLIDRKDIYQKISQNNENEKVFAPLNTSNVENQMRNITVILKNPGISTIKQKALK